MFRFFLGWGLMAVALVLFAGAAQAEPLNDLSAQISVTMTGTDNKLSSAGRNAHGDIFWTISPEISLKRRFAFGEVSLSAGGDGYVYATTEELNVFFARTSGSLTLSPTNRIQLDFSDTFSPAPLAFSNTEDNRINQIQTNRAVGTLHYQAPLSGPWDGTLSVQGDRTELLDWDDVFIGPKPDRTGVSGAAMLRRGMGRRSNLTLEASLGRTFFDKEIFNFAPLPSFSDYTLFASILTWNFQLQRNLSLGAGGGAGRLFTYYERKFTGTGLGYLQWSSGERTEVRFEGRRGQSAQTNGATFTSSTFSLTASHRITRQVQARLEGLISLLSGAGYNLGSTQIYSIKPSLNFTLDEYFDVQWAYQYAQRNAQLPGVDFSRHMTSVTLTGHF